MRKYKRALELMAKDLWEDYCGRCPANQYNKLDEYICPGYIGCEGEDAYKCWVRYYLWRAENE